MLRSARRLGRLVVVASAAVLTSALVGLGLGVPAEAQPTSSTATAAACAVNPKTPKRDLRALWIASVVNIDWPSKTGLTAAQQQRELTDWYDYAVRSGHNAVVVQIRPTADAFWPSAKEPWSRYLTGTQGVDPGWDPLGFAVAEAHKRNLQFHAWFNPYRISMDTNLAALTPDHPARVHPDWVISYGGKLYYNPGIPEARKFSVEAIMDAVKRYDLDAVHFDDYFYPYPVAGQTFNDAATYAQYGGGLSLADWRRKNIDTLITELGDAIKTAKPWVQFGVSPFAIWRNDNTDPTGSPTRGGVQTYDDLYADTRKWVKQEWIDYIVPQIYWSRGFTVADYEKLTDWWASEVRGTDVNLYIGQATYKVAANADPNWAKPDELSSHLDFNTRYPEVQGNIYFSAVQARADRLGATTLLNNTWYTKPALLPEAKTVRLRPALPVSKLKATAGSAGVSLSWSSTDRAHQFAIYRVSEGTDTGARSCAIADASNLVAVINANGDTTPTFVDPAGTGAHTYLVTAINRAGQESAPRSS